MKKSELKPQNGLNIAIVNKNDIAHSSEFSGDVGELGDK